MLVGLGIDSFCELRQLFVGFRLFLESLFQQRSVFRMPENVGEFAGLRAELDSKAVGARRHDQLKDVVLKLEMRR